VVRSAQLLFGFLLNAGDPSRSSVASGWDCVELEPRICVAAGLALSSTNVDRVCTWWQTQLLRRTGKPLSWGGWGGAVTMAELSNCCQSAILVPGQYRISAERETLLFAAQEAWALARRVRRIASMMTCHKLHVMSITCLRRSRRSF